MGGPFIPLYNMRPIIASNSVAPLEGESSLILAVSRDQTCVQFFNTRIGHEIHQVSRMQEENNTFNTRQLGVKILAHFGAYDSGSTRESGE
jgi:hypothetical protein